MIGPQNNNYNPSILFIVDLIISIFILRWSLTFLSPSKNCLQNPPPSEMRLRAYENDAHGVLPPIADLLQVAGHKNTKARV